MNNPLPTEASARKRTPIYTGLLRFFPDALAAVAVASYVGSKQHHKDDEVWWDRSKSGDELDALARHLLAAGTVDTDGIRHSAKVAWRALANLQKEIEQERKLGQPDPLEVKQYIDRLNEHHEGDTA